MRAATPACSTYLHCYRNDGHSGQHAYPTPIAPRTADIFDRLMALWQQPWSEAAFGEAQMLICRLRVAAVTPVETPGLDVERLARALALTEVGCWANKPVHEPEQDDEVHARDAAAIAAEYARITEGAKP